ncbi:MAG: M13 family metallopeptidase [Pirellulaceae bacterium]
MNRIITFVIPAVALLCTTTLVAQDANTEGVSGKVSGIDQSLLSKDVSPGENFYRYSNAKWLDETKIPGDKSNYGIFTMLNDLTQEQVKTLIESAAESKSEPGSAAQKVGDLYRSVLDVPARNQAGIEPIASILAITKDLQDTEAVAEAMGKLLRKGVYGALVPYVSVDARDSENYTVYVSQSGLTLPDRDYYLEDEERYVELREKLVIYVKDMLDIVGHSDSMAAAKNVLEIEKQIAAAQWTKTENRDPEATYNKKTPQEMDSLLAAFPWSKLSAVAGVESQAAFVVRQPSYFEKLGKMFADIPASHWSDYLTFKVIDAYATTLSEDTERRHFDFHETAISGISEQEPHWKRGVNMTGSVLGELVGQLYVEEHFKPAAKKRMNELVENLKRAFVRRINTRDWMGEGTKKQALEKLTKFTTKIGYPDEWKDYSKLTIVAGPLATNAIASSEFEYQRDLEKLGGPIDRNEWHMTPQTINAYYNPTMNEIVFPAAILQPPFFNMAADDAVNYGGIGAVIGHELSHGFDDKGSKYDGDGNLRKWWTEEDRTEFEKRAEGLVQQYDAFEPIAGNFVNGKLTLGENIGDLGGLSVAYEAYRLSLDDNKAPVIDGLTGDQRFFLGWGQIWRRLYREPELLKRLVTDPHSPSEFRVNGIVRNMDAWYKAFGVDSDAKLYLPADERVRIW